MGKKVFLLVLVLAGSGLIYGSDSFCSIDKQLDKEVIENLKKFRSQYNRT